MPRPVRPLDVNLLNDFHNLGTLGSVPETALHGHGIFIGLPTLLLLSSAYFSICRTRQLRLYSYLSKFSYITWPTHVDHFCRFNNYSINNFNYFTYSENFSFSYETYNAPESLNCYGFNLTNTSNCILRSSFTFSFGFTRQLLLCFYSATRLSLSARMSLNKVIHLLQSWIRSR